MQICYGSQRCEGSQWVVLTHVSIYRLSEMKRDIKPYFATYHHAAAALPYCEVYFVLYTSILSEKSKGIFYEHDVNGFHCIK